MIAGGALAVIPVRLGATRLPGKPLLPLAGRPVVQWVHDAAAASDLFDAVVVATDSTEIAETVTGFGGEVVMTSTACRTGTERVAEVARQRAEAVVANVQGDQPFVTSEMLAAVLQPFESEPWPDMSTVACPLASDELMADPSAVKVVRTSGGRALYFSRSAIPHGSRAQDGLALHHLGLYAFSQDGLARVAALDPSPLELAEGLEQLRLLEAGGSIAVTEVAHHVIEINTADDYERAQALVGGSA